jgi:hypothetical protein
VYYVCLGCAPKQGTKIRRVCEHVATKSVGLPKARPVAYVTSDMSGIVSMYKQQALLFRLEDMSKEPLLLTHRDLIDMI